MYTDKLGFVSIRKDVYVLKQVKTLMRVFKNKPDVEILSALREVADVKSHVSSIRAPMFLQIGALPNFAPKSDAFNALHRLLIMSFESAGLIEGKYDPKEYREDPILSLIEVIDRIVAQEVSFISLSEDLSGEKTLWGAYMAEFVEWIHNMDRISVDGIEIQKNLNTYRMHIIYKLARKQALDPAERTFLCNYYPGSPYTPKHEDRKVEWDGITQGAENSNPLVTRDFGRVSAVSSAGPFSKYFKMISNQSIEQLTAIIIPGVTSLPLMVGDLIHRGITSECDLTLLSSVPYNDNMELQGFRERIRCPEPRLASEAEVSKKGEYLKCTPTLPAIVEPLFGIFNNNASLPFDLAEVELELRRDSLDPSEPYVGLRASWYSKWRDRKVTTDNGATFQDLLTDIAIASATYGQGAPIEATLTEGAVIDAYEPSITARVISFGTLASDAISAVKYTIYFLRNAKLEERDVDMRFFYARRGTQMILPAYVEYIHPPMSMLYTPAASAVEYLSTELGMTREELKINELALTVSFNFAEATKLLKGQRPPLPRGDIKQYVSTLLGL